MMCHVNHWCALWELIHIDFNAIMLLIKTWLCKTNFRVFEFIFQPFNDTFNALQCYMQQLHIVCMPTCCWLIAFWPIQCSPHKGHKSSQQNLSFSLLLSAQCEMTLRFSSFTQGEPCIHPFKRSRVAMLLLQAIFKVHSCSFRTQCKIHWKLPRG